MVANPHITFGMQCRVAVAMASGAPDRAACVVSDRYPCTHVSEGAELNTSPMHRYQLLTDHARKSMMLLVIHARRVCNVWYGSLHCSRTSSENPACVVHSVQCANVCILSCSVASQAPCPSVQVKVNSYAGENQRSWFATSLKTLNTSPVVSRHRSNPETGTYLAFQCAHATMRSVGRFTPEYLQGQLSTSGGK